MAATSPLVRTAAASHDLLTSATKPDGRFELTQLKEQLAEALGDDGPLYWAALREFVQGKLNRQEFDFYAYMYLSGEKAVLHNKFILATIHNAQSGQAPPDGERNEGFEGSKKRKHDENVDVHGSSNDDSKQSRRSIKALLEDPKWRYVKELVKSLNKNERRAIKTLLKRPNITPEAAQEAIRSMKPVVLPLPASQLPQTYAMDIAKGITAPLVYDTKATPDIESLSYRMVAIALEQGLAGGITRDAGELLLYALDCHLKNVVSNMIYKVRSNRALGIPVSSTGASNSEVPTLKTNALSHPTTGGLRLRDRLYYSKNTLHLSDLVFSLEISPSSTVETPLCLERCGSLMTNQVLAEINADDDEDLQNKTFAGADRASNPTRNMGILEIADTSPSTPPVPQTASNAKVDSGIDEDDHKHKRKMRRLRARYERWFGPYVTVQYGNGALGDS
ncbi:hypothetical protein GGI25_000496 [Coemansia spiralis]|uniref:Uncharacterized protein n=2 Tax=Coemansia TaxID=4863 RepID=A0A9W8KZ93_9FUNG|nr:hypothetical protein EDC05_000323 [Coemansia umbellata]KAJ2625400.1 hypothetical protein GGI26_000540 [Coemansia sp. RSA 1358]KAJ2680523.1 hypothetical protein GGI25_000496 [Coemansia spiralis]